MSSHLCPARWRGGIALRLMQTGYSLVGVALGLVLTSLIAIWASNQLVQRIEDAAAHSTGVWLTQVRLALAGVLNLHFDALANGQAPLGSQGKPLFVNPLMPTVAELRTQGHLPADFPEQSSMGFGAQIRIARAPACPGASCRLDGLVYSATPVLKRGAQVVDLVGISAVIAAAGGYAGAVWPQSPGVVRGAVFSFANPLASGAPRYLPGTLALWAGAGTGGGGGQLDVDRFVTLRDTRDPMLRGALSVASNMSAGGRLAVGGVLSTATDVSVGGHIVMAARAVPGHFCPRVNGTLATSHGGELLSCQGNVWTQASGGFGGAYSVNAPRGCWHYTGVPTVNPRTGDCSCPAGFTSVIVSAGGKWTDNEGWTTGYVCVR
ncbi:prepilin [Achromobacter seleniivolatilans]|uniref:Prepilin n=1 Tax=Achromobacter seleniivolatilans TaxID=3047478 RepID=A0ABY9M8Y7_9BURK|nr:prepilin [Achromobacter sp. R39]WMD23142.1 prepilin [Achromobacter sp. R39]